MRGTWLTKRVRAWLERAEAEHTVTLVGGDQRCPWCRRWMQQNQETVAVPFDGNPMLDEIRCGHCEGASLWKWEVGFIYVMRTDPPPEPECQFGDGEFITAIIREAREALEGRR